MCGNCFLKWLISIKALVDIIKRGVGMSSYKGAGPRERPRTKHVCGKCKKPRCMAKRISGGNSCSCGCFGKKLDHIPQPYADNEKFMMRTRKWLKKRGIDIVRKCKEAFE